MDFKALMGGEESSASFTGRAASTAASLSGEKGCLPSLSFQTRVIGFGVCFGVGFLLSMLSTMYLISFNAINFAVLYTLGNILSFMSTGFLVGPVRQIKFMFHPKRWMTSLVVIGALIGTLLVAILTHSVVGTLVMILIQLLAMIWYTLSWIPYGRDMVMKACASCIK